MSVARASRGKTERYYRMRESVVQVAVSLFAEHGYDSTGVADIGDAAGLARGALYYYIGSKDALLAEIHNGVVEPLLSEADAISTMDVGFHVQLRLLSESLLWGIIHRYEHTWVFLHEHRRLRGRHFEELEEKRRRLEATIARVLEKARDGGALRVSDVDLAMRSFLNLHQHTYQWIADHEDLEVDELSRFYCDLFLNGVLDDRSLSTVTDPDLERGRRIVAELRSLDTAPPSGD